MNPFTDIIGQDKVKSKLNFYLDNFNKTGRVPFLNFVGASGLGKTKFARAFGKACLGSDGNPRPMYEVNCSGIKNLRLFLENFFLPKIQDSEAVIFFDEAHCLPRDVMMAFLSVFNTEAAHIKDFNYNDSVYTFDFKKQIYMFATTESDKLFGPLKNRLTTIDFDSYPASDLTKIFLACLPEVSFKDDALELLISTTRGNARDAVLRAQEVGIFCGNKEITEFTLEHTKELFTVLGILPFGLNHVEMRLLHILRETGPCSLQALAAKTGLSRTAIQKDFELYLLKRGFMDIDGLRRLTSKGNDALNHIAAFK